MPQPISKIADSLRSRYKHLMLTRTRIEALLGEGRITRSDVERMYEGLFLNAHKSFEGFLETLFFSLLVQGSGYSSSRNNIKVRVTLRSHKVAREIVFAGRRYVDWLPYDQTISRAKLCFTGGRPFTDLPDASIKQLEDSTVLRNAIAHTSRHSQQRFANIFLSGISLPARQRTPAGYLRDVYATAPSQTRLELFMAQLANVAIALAR